MIVTAWSTIMVPIGQLSSGY